MKIDGKKKKAQVVPVLQEALPEASQKAEEETEEEEEDEDEDEEYEEDSGYGTSRTTSEEDISEDETDAEESPAKVMKKKLPTREAKKTKAPPSLPSKTTKRKLPEVQQPTKKPNLGEKKHPKIDQTKSVDDKKSKKKADLVFDDTNLDLNLHNADPTNVVSRRVLLNNNLIMTSKMINQATNNLTYDYAALAFQRKTNSEKMFEFLLPLSLVPRIIQGLEYIQKENPKFFANKHQI